MAVTRTETDGTTVTYPTAFSDAGPRHEATVRVLHTPTTIGGGTTLVVTERGPRGGEKTVPVSLNAEGTAALRAEVRPAVRPMLPLARPGVVAEAAADARDRLAAITAAVELLGTADGRELAAVRDILVEVGALLAPAVEHAVPEKMLAKAGERFR